MTNNTLNTITEYGIGIAGENLVHGQKNLSIFMADKLPFSQGEIAINPGTYTVTGKDSKGNSYTTKLSTDMLIYATYWATNHNEISAPQIVRGQRVMVYRNSQTDSYLWRSLNMDNHLSRNDTHVSAYAAKGRDKHNKEDGDEKLSVDNSYQISISTAEKELTITTSKANNEPLAFRITLNTGKGVFSLEDDKGNKLVMDCVNDNHLLTNSNGSFLNIDKNNITLNCADTMSLKSKTLNVENETMNIKNSETTYNNDKFNMQSQDIDVNCPMSKFKGMVQMGSFATTGAGGTDGGGEIKGNIDVKGSQTITGNLTALGSVSFPAGGSSGRISGSGD